MIISLLKTFFKFTFLKRFQYSFYSESKFYQNNFKTLVNSILKNGNEILYLSSDKNDYFKDKNVTNIFLKNKYERFIAFLMVRTKYFFLTVINLGNNELKTSRNVNYYVYVFHSIKSCHKDIPLKSFDNYDIILCCGTHHINEIKLLENYNNCKKKILINSGYFYFEYCQSKISEIKNIEPENILLAFSWSYNSKNFFDLHLEDFINKLIVSNKVILRPHPEHYKRSKITLDKILKKFSDNVNFKLDNNHSNIDSMSKSKILFTDNSGIALEFLLLFKRPIIYFDNFNRIQNNDYFKMGVESFEDKIKKKYGKSIHYHDIDDYSEFINKTINTFKKNTLDSLEVFIKNELFNYNQSPSTHTYKELLKIN